MSLRARRFLRSLIAVLAGNAAYFAAVPYLPPGAYHEPWRLDWGLLVDFWFCVAAYGLLGLVKWFR
jgi:quinol-cytochrome oxidoreductase complex cytochrome b subunit